MEFNLHIERVVLDGVDVGPGQGDLLGASVRDELARLFDGGGLALNLVGGASLNQVTANNSVREVSGQKISIESNNGPLHIGDKIANAVYHGMEK